jgi:hypothetical protein
MWSNITTELEPNLKYSKDNCDEHQLLSMWEQFVKQTIANIKSWAKYSPSESQNAMWLLQTNLKHIEQNGLLNNFVKSLDNETQTFLTDNKLLALNE